MRHNIKMFALAMVALMMLSPCMCLNLDNADAETNSYRLLGTGYNAYGQQGSGNTDNVTSFTQRATGVASVVCSQYTTWYIDSDGVLYGCGLGTSGQQGSGTSNVTSFTQRATGVASVVCSDSTTWYLTTDGKLYGCGLGTSGQQGSGNTDNVTSFTQRATGVASVVCSQYTTWYLTTDGKLYGCGWNSRGQQGSGNTNNVTSFTQRATGVASVVCSDSTTWYLTTDGKLYGCGLGTSGQQGSGTSNVTSFTQRATGVASVVCSTNTTWYLTTDGKLYGCGLGTSGQQGSGTSNVTSFTQRATGVASVVCSDSTTWYLTTDGKLYGCGLGTSGQQGSGNTDNVTSFTQRATGVASVVCSLYTTWFIDSDGVLYGCGSNGYGAQGSGDTTNVTSFTSRLQAENVIVAPANTITSPSYDVTWVLAESITYTVTWKSQDGTTTLETDTDVAYGSQPSYDGSTPTKASTAQYTYAFAGWATSTDQTTGTAVGSLPTVTASVTYYAAFSETVNTFDVVWKSQDGTTTLETDTDVAYGSQPSYDGSTPTKASTAQYTYAFAGWATSTDQTTGTAVGSLPTVTASVTYYAAFSETVNTYTVTLADDSSGYGSVSPASVANVPYGMVITVTDNTLDVNGTTVTATPLTSTPQYRYSFTSWTGLPTNNTVVADVTITANFERGESLFTVTWKSQDGTEIYETDTNITYNTAPSYDGSTPTKASTAQYTYAFAGWATSINQTTGTPVASLPNVTADTIYYAAFSETLRSYTITWSISGATTTETYSYGETPTHADPTAPEGYVFVRWDPTITTVTGDQTYTAVFVEEGDVLVYFDASTNGGRVSTASKSVTTGAAIGELPTATKTNYDFVGWFTAAEGGTEITADTIVESETSFTIYAQFELMQSVQTMKVIIIATITMLFIGVAVAVVGRYRGDF